MQSQDPTPTANFIRHIVESDLAANKNNSHIATRFPPEPNGYLHIGHLKSICLNFGIAEDFNGLCNLRFDDTNPEKENQEFIDAIRKDVSWLGFQWANECYASDYFEQLYQFAEQLIARNLAYVDSQSAEEIRNSRGTLTQPGKESPYRTRSIEENLDLFRRMRQGEFADGAHVLRAKIDMNAGNINLRDPALYRIRHVPHHRQGQTWCIYPMYDFTHCISDAIEQITHSLCTLEFEDHRALYDWVLDNIEIDCHPQQTEFARLQLEHTLLSKRKLQRLVENNVVDGWDDPRMPTIAGLRRRGYPPQAMRDFCERIGVTKKDAWIKLGVLEYSVREILNQTAERRMAVLKPLRVNITNLTQATTIRLPNHPLNPEAGERELLLTPEVFIEQDDFALTPPPKFKRLIEGGEVRLRGGYVIKCLQVHCDEQGTPVCLDCEADLDTLGKKPEGRKVKGVIHWVSASEGVPAQVNLYQPLFLNANPADGDELNPDSLIQIDNAVVEPAAAHSPAGVCFQFERQGYFCTDEKNHQALTPVFNQTVSLRDSYPS